MAQIPAGTDRSGELTRKQTGDARELQARRWLERKGLRFIAANVRVRGGEIDLIMQDGRPSCSLRCATASQPAMAVPLPA